MQWIGIAIVAIVMNVIYFDSYQIIYKGHHFNDGKYYSNKKNRIFMGITIYVLSFLVDIIIINFTSDAYRILFFLWLQMCLVSILLVLFMWIKNYNRNRINFTIIGSIFAMLGVALDMLQHRGDYWFLVICLVIGGVFYNMHIYVLFEISDEKHLKYRKEHMENMIEEIEKASQIENDRQEIMDEFVSTYGGEIADIKRKLVESMKNQDAVNLDDEIDMSIAKLRRNNYCDEQIANTIIERMSKKCIENDINLAVTVERTIRLNIDGLIISSVLNNLLDNAFNYCKLFSEKKDRYITLNIDRQGDYIHFLVTNSYFGSDSKRKIRENGTDIRHGYGSKILNDIAEKYNGEYITEINGNIFLASMIVCTEKD